MRYRLKTLILLEINNQKDMLDHYSAELGYVRLLLPKFATRSMEVLDENNNMIIVQDCDTSLYNFIKRVNEDQINPPFTKSKYLNNRWIIPTIEEVFKLDVEQFWYALLFIYDYVQGVYVGKKRDEENPSVETQLIKLADYLESHPQAEIIVKGSSAKKLTIGNDEFLGKYLKSAINSYFWQVKEWLDNEEVAIERKALFYPEFFYNRKVSSVSFIDKEGILICRATKMYKELFMRLGFGKSAKRLSSCSGGSFNQMALFSRIVFFYGFTTNETYLEDDDNIKKAYDSNRQKSITNAKSPIY